MSELTALSETFTPDSPIDEKPTSKTPDFGDVVKSYPPEFVAKYYQPQSESFLSKRNKKEIDTMPKTEVHALIVMELELMYGTEYAKDVNERLRKFWDIRDHMITQRTLARDYDAPDLLPDVDRDLAKLLIETTEYSYSRRLEKNDVSAAGAYHREVHANRQRVVSDYLGFKALKTLEQAAKWGSISEEDKKFLEEQRDSFINSFFEQVSESGFSIEELQNLLKKGKLIIRDMGSFESTRDVYIFLHDKRTNARAFIMQKDFFNTTGSQFEVKYSPDFTDQRDDKYSRYTIDHGLTTEEDSERVLGAIRSVFLSES